MGGGQPLPAPTPPRGPNAAQAPQGPSPAIAVGGVHVDPEVQQEPDDVVVAGADGVVQRRDPFVVGLAGVFHLRTQGAVSPASWHPGQPSLRLQPSSPHR